MKTYFISGHTSITEEEFETHYAPKIRKLAAQADTQFVVGDAAGADTMAQLLLYELGVSHRVIVYHMLEHPRNQIDVNFKLKGGYESDEERDAAMTAASDEDILWIRPGKETSGTAKNWERRYGRPYRRLTIDDLVNQGRQYTTFTGADIRVIADGEPIGQVQEIRYGVQPGRTPVYEIGRRTPVGWIARARDLDAAQEVRHRTATEVVAADEERRERVRAFNIDDVVTVQPMTAPVGTIFRYEEAQRVRGHNTDVIMVDAATNLPDDEDNEY